MKLSFSHVLGETPVKRELNWWELKMTAELGWAWIPQLSASHLVVVVRGSGNPLALAFFASGASVGVCLPIQTCLYTQIHQFRKFHFSFQCSHFFDSCCSCKGLFETSWVKLSKLKNIWGVFWSDVWAQKWLTSHSAWAWSFEVSEQYSFWGWTFLFVYSFSRRQLSEFLRGQKNHFQLILGQNNAGPRWFVFSVLAWNPSRILLCSAWVL